MKFIIFFILSIYFNSFSNCFAIEIDVNKESFRYQFNSSLIHEPVIWQNKKTNAKMLSVALWDESFKPKLQTINLETGDLVSSIGLSGLLMDTSTFKVVEGKKGTKYGFMRGVEKDNVCALIIIDYYSQLVSNNIDIPSYTDVGGDKICTDFDIMKVQMLYWKNSTYAVVHNSYKNENYFLLFNMDQHRLIKYIRKYAIPDSFSWTTFSEKNEIFLSVADHTFPYKIETINFTTNKVVATREADPYIKGGECFGAMMANRTYEYNGIQYLVLPKKWCSKEVDGDRINRRELTLLNPLNLTKTDFIPSYDPEINTSPYITEDNSLLHSQRLYAEAGYFDQNLGAWKKQTITTDWLYYFEKPSSIGLNDKSYFIFPFFRNIFTEKDGGESEVTKNRLIAFWDKSNGLVTKFNFSYEQELNECSGRSGVPYPGISNSNQFKIECTNYECFFLSYCGTQKNNKTVLKVFSLRDYL